jgi:hypothetical protein
MAFGRWQPPAGSQQPGRQLALLLVALAAVIAAILWLNRYAALHGQ